MGCDSNKSSKSQSLRSLLVRGSQSTSVRRPIQLLFSALCLFLLFNNMRYSTFVSDHESYLLQFRRRIDPSFALNDWFVEEVQEHHFAFTEILVYANNFLTIQQTLYVLFVMNFIFLSIAIGLICHKAQMGAPGFLLAMTLTQLLDGKTIGDVNFLPATSLPHYLSLSLFLLSYWAHINGYTKLLTLMITFMLYMNFSTGFFALLFFNLVWLCSLRAGKLRLKNLILQNLFISVNALIILVITNFTFVKNNVDRRDYAIYFELRAPHHYLYNFFTPSQYALTFCLLTLVYFLQRKTRTQLPDLDTFVIFLIVLAFLSVVSNFLFIPEFLRLFPYRLFPILIPFSAILLAWRILKSNSKLSLLFWNLLTILLLLISKSQPMSDLAKRQNLLSSRSLIFLFVFLFIISFLVSQRYLQNRQRALVSFSALAIFLVVIFTFPTYKIHQDLKTYDVDGLYQITMYVPQGETILVPPSAGEVRFLGQRAIVVDYATAPLDLNLMGFWKERIIRLGCGFKFDESLRGYELWDELSIQYNKCPVTNLIQIAKDFEAKYILLEEKSTSDGKSLLIPVRKFGIYDLFRIP
jgi:hypothetical protein